MINTMIKKTVLLALAVALGWAGMSFNRVAAAGAYDPAAPPKSKLTEERLERVWSRQLRVYERMGRAEDFVERVQRLIDRAGRNGRDVSEIQAALDAFDKAVKDAKPIYASANGIVNSHQGFDSNEKVTDLDTARETVQQMGEKLKEIRGVMDGTGQALREAIRAFHEANPRPEQTPTP